jgi:UDP-glucose 4-epimerase
VKIVVTGAAGYIGGQIMLAAADAGHQVMGIDYAPLPHHLASFHDRVRHRNFINAGINIHHFSPDAVIHCAGTSLVGPSVTNPAEYYQNNVVNFVWLLDLMVAHLPQCRLMFSSSAAVYGRPTRIPCLEKDAVKPISPYGHSKHMAETMMASYAAAYGLDYVAFRYFNACGADPQIRHGQAPGATHLIARLLESVRDGTDFVCNGNNYSTTDGTCIRDYVHVADIARAHLLALDTAVPAGVYNLGTGSGHSTLQVVDAARAVTGQKIEVTYGPPRPGDPPVLAASSARFNRATGWAPQYTLDQIVDHAWQWYNRR